MQATSEGTAKFALALDYTAFKNLIKALHGDKSEAEIREICGGYGDSEWSLIKNGKRYVPQHMLAVCTHTLLPDLPLRTYTMQVPFKPRGAR